MELSDLVVERCPVVRVNKKKEGGVIGAGGKRGTGDREENAGGRWVRQERGSWWPR